MHHTEKWQRYVAPIIDPKISGQLVLAERDQADLVAGAKLIAGVVVVGRHWRQVRTRCAPGSEQQDARHSKKNS
jgi:hypothetical protein